MNLELGFVISDPKNFRVPAGKFPHFRTSSSSALLVFYACRASGIRAFQTPPLGHYVYNRRLICPVSVPWTCIWLPQYCRNCATITDGAVKKQLNADAEISLLPTRVFLNGALLPSQCWYLLFNGTFVYLGSRFVI